MPKQLIVEPCLINYQDDRGGVHHDAGDFVEVPKDVALDLARAGRTLFVNRDDDPTKGGIHTASDKMVAAAEAMKKKPKDGDKSAQA
jgi:hypothetical protein